MTADEDGLGLVEVVIAIVLLGLIAILLIPVLFQGVARTSVQSSTATATRFLNSLVEEARELQDCTLIPSVLGRTVDDGNGVTMTSEGALSGCAPGAASTLTISVRQAGTILASTTARIYIP